MVMGWSNCSAFQEIMRMSAIILALPTLVALQATAKLQGAVIEIRIKTL